MTEFVKNLFGALESKPKIVFPEGDNPAIIRATEVASEFIEPILLNGEDALIQAAEMVANGEADSMVAGIDYTSRDVILAARDHIGATGKTFSSSFIIDLPDGRVVALADCATCKNPTAEQLADIIIQTVDETYHPVFADEPRIACLSFSTHNSGGHDASIDKIHETITLVRTKRPELMIDGEMQLDAAIDPVVGKKKAPRSPVAGRANVLILPDLNSGNILYKSMEQFGRGHAYGPILQGFKAPVSDLSRGSTLEDVLGVIAITAARLKN